MNREKWICKSPLTLSKFRLTLTLELQKMGSICPVPPKVKIQAALSLFGIVYFVLILYTMMRNIFYNRIE